MFVVYISAPGHPYELLWPGNFFGTIVFAFLFSFSFNAKISSDEENADHIISLVKYRGGKTCSPGGGCVCERPKLSCRPEKKCQGVEGGWHRFCEL